MLAEVTRTPGDNAVFYALSLFLLLSSHVTEARIEFTPVDFEDIPLENRFNITDNDQRTIRIPYFTAIRMTVAYWVGGNGVPLRVCKAERVFSARQLQIYGCSSRSSKIHYVGEIQQEDVVWIKS